MGVHGNHGDLLHDSLSDVITLVKRKPRKAKLLLTGYWNVDQLPDLQCDPWTYLPDRHTCHRDRRITLSTFCDSLAVKVVLPSRAVSAVGGPFAEEFMSVPFTRVPVGESTTTQLPSL